MSVESLRLQKMKAQLQPLSEMEKVVSDLLEEITKVPSPSSSNPVLDGLYFPAIQFQGLIGNFARARVNPEDLDAMGVFTDKFLDLPRNLRTILRVLSERFRQIPPSREFAQVKAKAQDLVRQMDRFVRGLEAERRASVERIVHLHIEKQAASQSKIEVEASRLQGDMGRLIHQMKGQNPPKAPLVLLDIRKTGPGQIKAIFQVPAQDEDYLSSAENWVYNALIVVSHTIPEFKDALRQHGDRDLVSEFG